MGVDLSYLSGWEVDSVHTVGSIGERHYAGGEFPVKGEIKYDFASFDDAVASSNSRETLYALRNLTRGFAVAIKRAEPGANFAHNRIRVCRG